MIDKNHLRSFIERVERLEEEKASIAEDIRSVYAEAKGNGFDVKALRQIIKLRKINADERQEQQAILETYMHMLGMLADTELGQAAITRRRTELEQEGREAFDGLQRAAKRVADNPKIRRSFNKLGTPTELTEEEKAKGYTAAFIDKKGNRMSIGLGNSIHSAPPQSESEVNSVTGGPDAVLRSEPPSHEQSPGEASAADNSDGMDIPGFLRRNGKQPEARAT